jgi:hypothetical protein
MDSIFDISVNIINGYKFEILMGNFLDEFYSTNNDNRIKMISKAPLALEQPEYVPFLAATAHKLANDYSLKIHNWVFNKYCYMPENQPYFPVNLKGNIRLFYMYTSPTEFKHRNLFIDENALIRV